MITIWIIHTVFLLRIDYKCNIETMLFFSNAAFIDGYQDFISGIMDSNIGQQQHRKGEKVIFFLDYCILVPSFPFFSFWYIWKQNCRLSLATFRSILLLQCIVGSEFWRILFGIVNDFTRDVYLKVSGLLLNIPT